MTTRVSPDLCGTFVTEAGFLVKDRISMEPQIVGQQERQMLKRRIKAGMEKVKALGTRSGAPIGRPRITGEQQSGIRSLRREAGATERSQKGWSCRSRWSGSPAG